MDIDTLRIIWFALIAVLWTGYLVLEGFDFGVGMLLPVLGRTDTERRVLINTIGPVLSRAKKKLRESLASSAPAPKKA